jgi:hypothetical protein
MDLPRLRTFFHHLGHGGSSIGVLPDGHDGPARIQKAIVSKFRSLARRENRGTKGRTAKTEREEAE